MKLIDIVLQHKDKPWDIRYLSGNPLITFQDVLDHPELKWDMEGISQNPSITFQDVASHPEIQWSMWGLSRNTSINMKDVLDHPELKWNIEGLSINPSITFQDVLANPQIGWDWKHLSSKTTMFRVTSEFKQELSDTSLHFANKPNSYLYYCIDVDFKIKQGQLNISESDKLSYVEKLYLDQFKKI